jgi:hypothetical protein
VVACGRGRLGPTEKRPQMKRNAAQLTAQMGPPIRAVKQVASQAGIDRGVRNGARLLMRAFQLM